MKNYLLLLVILVTGCQQLSSNKMQVYYSSPELVGAVLYNKKPVINARIYLLTSCNDQYSTTDLIGNFTFSPACMELIPRVPHEQVGYFYQLIIDIGREQYLWRVGGLGYGFKMANVEIDLATKQVNYQVVEGVATPYKGVALLENLRDILK